MVIIGYAVAALGIIFILVGVIWAAFDVQARRGAGFARPSSTVVQILAEIPKIIAALAKAPRWLAMTLVGIGLVVCGVRIVAGLWPFG